jgi:hypothetical protein
MSKTRAKALRKELKGIMAFAYNNAPITPHLWRGFKRNYVRSH